MDFISVNPTDLRAHWPQISASLDVVQTKSPEDWIKEDVYHAIKSGHAACHMAYAQGQYAGLLVTSVSMTEFSRQQALHVWIAHNEGDRDVIDAGVDLLRAAAARGGFTRITFGSSRKGWAKRFPLISATYEITL